MIDSLESLCKEEGIQDFVLAGHSLGGYLAAKYAVKYPDRVKSLVLISPAGIAPLPKKEEYVRLLLFDYLHYLFVKIRFVIFSSQYTNE